MRCPRLLCILLGVIELLQIAHCLEPLSMSMLIIGGVTAGIGLVSRSCLFSECCSDGYIKLNSTGLKRDLNSRLHGQHLVIPTVLNSISGHVNNQNPSKPLVLSFHGWTGGGKNYVSKFIVGNLFFKKEKSNFVHLFNSEIHFKNKDRVEEYKDKLHGWIYHNVSNCARSIFIFDEMDHMPEGMIDVLVPFLGHSTHIDGVDFRKTIFIFLSNTGGDKITEVVYKHWQNGKKREDIRLRDMQEPLELVAYNAQSGLKRSKLVHKNLVDHFVPFLPLERSHVRNCVIDEIKRQNLRMDEKFINEVLKELSWFPKGVNLYSKSGCKKVAQKVSIIKEG
uniref:torsin-1A-like n=1 Tax=Styela clava TaxID=7725 RepID=UPI001939316E|nr:torsin-1A-like [Styela clava]